ncbi:MAG: bifunctional glutamate N-acetyltransferase/amino-acid acetyltransferase ArgJ [Bacillota bacterium]|nr:bifunctional glutamate N-acetyltransferase/amino-acid acetyltransferase ArgJ [Bacillota bacterium]
MESIQGGVCAPKGFKAAGVCCGIRGKGSDKKDLALIVSDVPAAAAAVYTANLVKGAPIAITRENLKDGKARAVICNSGNANTCNADGPEIARGMCRLVEKAAGIPAADVIVASTGVIGQPLSLAPMAAAIDGLVSSLGTGGSGQAAEAILTTDLRTKEIAVAFQAGGRTCALGGIAKGSGMIHPNMATMLAFLTTDLSISPELLQKALSEDVKDTYNMISVDGDTSTNDTVAILANGLAGNETIVEENRDYEAFRQALALVNTYLCRAIAGDGEGATKLLECSVTGATDKETACKAAKAVICSDLVKTAMFGADANWGRVLCAIGYCGGDIDIDAVGVEFVSHAGRVRVCGNGAGVPFSEELAARVLGEKEIVIEVCLGPGPGEARAWGCDLSYDYVRINGDYRS